MSTEQPAPEPPPRGHKGPGDTASPMLTSPAQGGPRRFVAEPPVPTLLGRTQRHLCPPCPRHSSSTPAHPKHCREAPSGTPPPPPPCQPTARPVTAVEASATHAPPPCSAPSPPPATACGPYLQSGVALVPCPACHAAQHTAPTMPHVSTWPPAALAYGSSIRVLGAGASPGCWRGLWKAAGNWVAACMQHVRAVQCPASVYHTAQALQQPACALPPCCLPHAHGEGAACLLCTEQSARALPLSLPPLPACCQCAAHCQSAALTLPACCTEHATRALPHALAACCPHTACALPQAACTHRPASVLPHGLPMLH